MALRLRITVEPILHRDAHRAEHRGDRLELLGQVYCDTFVARDAESAQARGDPRDLGAIEYEDGEPRCWASPASSRCSSQ